MVRFGSRSIPPIKKFSKPPLVDAPEYSEIDPELSAVAVEACQLAHMLGPDRRVELRRSPGDEGWYISILVQGAS